MPDARRGAVYSDERWVYLVVCVSVKLKVEITKYRLPTYVYEFISTSLLGLWAMAMVRP